SASNATHQLTARAYDTAGNVSSASLSVVTSNADAVPVVTLPQPLPHVRVAELVTAASQLDSFAKDLLRTSVDLVVSQDYTTAAVTAAAPDTPQALYTNVSTLYLDLLTDWLAFADAN